MRTWVAALIAPLAIAANLFAATPWLRAFPFDTIGVILFAAAVLSVLVPIALVRLGLQRLWATVLIDAAAFVVYGLVVVLHDPTGFSDLVAGLYHGPSQILSFALPLVSPRSLMLAPVALTWLVGAAAGECVARRWSTPAIYIGFLLSYGLAYAATMRTVTNPASNIAAIFTQPQAPLAAALLATLLLLRTCQTWLRQDSDAEAMDAEGVLPVRGLFAGVAIALVIGLGAWMISSAAVPSQTPATPNRLPQINSSDPVTPVSFVAGLRTSNRSAPGTAVFNVHLDKAAPGYFSIANLDAYDGQGWSWDRTFLPSGGVIQIPDSTTTENTVTQTYGLTDGPLAGQPWMPYLQSPQQVTGISINADQSSGMIVPAQTLNAGETYSVDSIVATQTFQALSDVAVPNSLVSVPQNAADRDLAQPLQSVIDAFAAETGVAPSPPLPFLKKMQQTLQSNYNLLGEGSSPASGTSPAPSSAATTSPAPSPAATPSAAPSSGAADERAASTSFADVAASILGTGRAGTPEQYATLVALVARQLGVPARISTGFRVDEGAPLDPKITYPVTTQDAWTWVDVPIVGEGWVVLDATPSQVGNPAPQPTVTASTIPPSATPTEDSVLSTGDGGHAAAPPSTVPDQGSTSRTWLVLGIAVLIVIVLVLAVVWLARKPLRARRRRNLPDPRARVRGAWAESMDVLMESGIADLTALTNNEIAARTRDEFGEAPARAAEFIGAQASVAVYSPNTALLESDAEDAWRAHRALRADVRRTLSARARVLARLRYHRSHDPR